ncbi:permuted papain-like amidase [Alishewanella phage vB_AspM_Slickus01]|nr:permuted papain-like amidase [Alishewanella phage vB_AspM_Slickus01]
MVVIMEFITAVFGSNREIGSLAIKVFTWSRFSHVGVLMPCGKVLESTFSDGVKLTPLAEFKARYNKIEFANIPCESASLAYERGYAQVDKKYDYLAIIGIFIKRSMQDENKWFCSELVAYMIGIYRQSRVNRVTPEMIYIISRHIPDPSEFFKGINKHGIRSNERVVPYSRR